MKKVNVSINFTPSGCTVKYQLDNELIEKKLTYRLIKTPHFYNDIFRFLIHGLKDLIISTPLESIKMICNFSDIKDQGFINQTKKINNHVVNVITQTSRIIREKQRKCFSNNDRVAFFGLPKQPIKQVVMKEVVGGKWFEDFFLYNNKIDHKSFFFEFPTHIVFDSTKRCWVKTGNVFKFDDLFHLIKDYNIKKVVYQNYYIMEHFLNTQLIHLPIILDYLGVETIGFDYDPYDYAFIELEKVMFHTTKSKRFNPYPSIETFWDEKYHLNTINYNTLGAHHEFKEEGFELKKNYDLLILSNSRLNVVKNHFAAILFVLSGIDEKTLFKDFQLWGWSMLDVIRNRLNLSDMDKLHFSGKIFQIMYHVGQFLKYEVIESLDTHKKIKIFGDAGWGKIFPEFYQNNFLDKEEISRLYQKNDKLLLCFNHGVNYLEASGPVVDSLGKKIPFLNFPLVVKNDSFKGFEVFEYKNIHELNEKIDCADKLFKKQEISSSLEAYQSILQKSENQIAEYIFHNSKSDENVYYASYLEHKKLLKLETEKYLAENGQFIQKGIDVLLNNQNFSVELNHSRFHDRKYVKRLVSEINKGKS